MFGYNYLYNFLKINQIEKFKSPNILKKYEKFFLSNGFLNLHYITQTLQQIFNLIITIKKGNEKILFIGHPYNKIINKIINYTAFQSNQFYYHFHLENVNYAELALTLKKLNPALIIAFSSTVSLPVLKIANNLNIPIFGICDASSNNDFLLTYYVLGDENSSKIIYCYCILILKLF
jgi:ribosomal protein S2